METLIALIVLLFSTTASAWQFEAGIGQTTYNPVANGTWYQDGFQHTLNLKHSSFMLGVTGRVNSWLIWHTDYEYLGRASENSWDTPSDANYNPSTPNHCNGPCLPLANYVGHGRVQGVALTLAPEYRLKDGLRVFANIGPFLYRSTWHEAVYNWFGQTVYLNHHTRWQIGAKLGVGIRGRHIGLEYDWYPSLHTTGDSIPALYSGAKVISIIGYF